MGLDLGGIGDRVTGAARKAVGGLEDGVRAVGSRVPGPVRGFGGDVLDVGREAVGELADAGRTAAAVVRHAPEAVPTWKRLWHAARTGERTLLPGVMPAYPTLDAAALAQAQARGQGRKLPQGFLTGEQAGGKTHEPVTLYVTGSKQALVAALRSRGWVENEASTPLSHLKQFLAAVTRFDRVTEGPVSSMYLDGKLPVVALSKNSDYNLARDHMRVYAAGTDPATGEPRWAIAATRDMAATVTLRRPVKDGPKPWDWKLPTPGFGHTTDLDLDGERDLIMHDLLGSGRVATWSAVAGERPGARVKPAPNGELYVNQYRTDGRIYDVRLGTPAVREGR